MSYDDVASAVLLSCRQIGLESRQHERKWLCLCGWSVITRHHCGREEVDNQTRPKAKEESANGEVAKDYGLGVEL